MLNTDKSNVEDEIKIFITPRVGKLKHVIETSGQT
jgi:hypothetical protein